MLVAVKPICIINNQGKLALMEKQIKKQLEIRKNTNPKSALLPCPASIAAPIKPEIAPPLSQMDAPFGIENDSLFIFKPSKRKEPMENKTHLSIVESDGKTHDDFIKEKSDEFLHALLVKKDRALANDVLESVAPRGELRLSDSD